MPTPSQHYRGAQALVGSTYADPDRALIVATLANAQAMLALAGVVGLLAAAGLLDSVDGEPADEQEAALNREANAWIEIATGVTSPAKPATA